MKMTVEMDVTTPQALALQAMFEHWNYMAGIGQSRYISFFVDGDGNFHPHCRVSFDEAIRPLTDELRKLGIREDINGTRKYDFDSIAWKLHS